MKDTTLAVTQGSNLHAFLFSFLPIPPSNPIKHHISSKSLAWTFTSPSHHLVARLLWQCLCYLPAFALSPPACDLHHCFRALSRTGVVSHLSPYTDPLCLTMALLSPRPDEVRWDSPSAQPSRTTYLWLLTDTYPKIPLHEPAFVWWLIYVSTWLDHRVPRYLAKH